MFTETLLQIPSASMPCLPIRLISLHKSPHTIVYKVILIRIEKNLIPTLLVTLNATHSYSHNRLPVSPGVLVCHVHTLGVPVRPENQVPPQGKTKRVIQLTR